MLMVEVAAEHDRREQRTNLFVMGAIYSREGSAPVRIRNLSATGALIEGSVIPPEMSDVMLTRGPLSVAAKVVWSRGNRAGLKFETHTSVAGWLPNARSNGPQQRVDEAIHQFRMSPADPTPCPQPADRRTTHADLKRANEMLLALAADLADDGDAIVRHASSLQALDHISQLLGKLMAERETPNNPNV